MPINLNEYINITSGVGAGSVVPGRAFIGRIFTTNPLLPTGSFKEFTSAADVATYFGSNSEEYARALFYFSFISKNQTTPQTLSFARWVNAATDPLIFGAKNAQVLANWTSISNGDISITMGGFTFHITGLDFTSAASLTNVASIITTAVQAESGGGALWTAAVVAWDAANSRFTLTGGATGPAVISVAAGATHDIAALLGWLASSAIFSKGAAIETITQTLNDSVNLSNNFGSFCFTYTAALNLTQVTEGASWNASQNVYYEYYAATIDANLISWSAALIGFAGFGLHIQGPAGEYHEMMPMDIMAATVYTNRNSVQNYMFYQFSTLTPTVTDTATAQAYNALRVNYLGQTQTAGDFVSFYQRGFLMGGATAPLDMNTYVNEMWLKDAVSSSALTLLLSLAQIPADTLGTNQLTINSQAVINQALFNGTITTGKPFNSAQIQFITNATGDDKAWQQVQNIGYWQQWKVVSYVADDIVQWKAVYLLIYSKDDVVRKVDGTDILI